MKTQSKVKFPSIKMKKRHKNRPRTPSGPRASLVFANFEITDSKTSLLESTFLLLFISQLIVGLILPILESFYKMVNEKKNNKINKIHYKTFLIIQYIVGICALSLIFRFIYKYQKEHKGHKKINFSQKTSAMQDLTNKRTKSPMQAEASFRKQVTVEVPEMIMEIHAERGESIDSSEDKKGSIFNEVNEIVDESSESQKSTDEIDFIDSEEIQKTEMSEKSINKGITQDLHPIEETKHPDSDEHKSEVIDDTKNEIDEEYIDEFCCDHENTILVHKEGMNFYLKIGTVVFGFGVILYDGVKIADFWGQNRWINTCHSSLWIPQYLLNLIFTLMQTYFIFKYDNIVFHLYKGLMRCLFAQLAVTNVCQWFRIVISELTLRVQESEKEKAHAVGNTEMFTNSTVEQKDVCANQLFHKISLFITPIMVEYVLTCGAVMYKLYQSVGEHSTSNDQLTNLTECSILEKLNRFTKSKRSRQIIERSSNKCVKSTLGLFGGLLLLIITVVGLAVYYIQMSEAHQRDTASHIFLGIEIILLLCGLVSTFIALYKMKCLKFIPFDKESAFDCNLLLIGFVGIVSYNLFIFLPATYTLHNRIDPNKHTKPMLYQITFRSLFEIVQASLQTMLIWEASRKCAARKKHVTEKPGRGMIVFLIVANMALWLVSVFEAEQQDDHSLAQIGSSAVIYYNQTMPQLNRQANESFWSIITHVLLPLVIFYRFHSTVCFSDIWIKAFRMKNSKIND